MKKIFSFLLVLAGLFLLTSNEVKAQSPTVEITITNTPSTWFYFEHHVEDCNNPGVIIGGYASKQAHNSGVAHYYNGAPNEVDYILTVVDQFGNWVHVGAPGSGIPSSAIIPGTTTTVDLHYYGCAHPTVVEIY